MNALETHSEKAEVKQILAKNEYVIVFFARLL